MQMFDIFSQKMLILTIFSPKCKKCNFGQFFTSESEKNEEVFCRQGKKWNFFGRIFKYAPPPKKKEVISLLANRPIFEHFRKKVYFSL